MSPALVALFALIVYGTGLYGWRLVRTPSGAAQTFGGSGQGRQQRSLIATLRQTVGVRLQPLMLRLMTDRSRRRLEHWLDASGRPDRMTIQDVAGIKASDTIVCIVIGVAALSISPFVLPFIVLYGYFRQDLQLRSKAKVRQAKIERDLPDYLDILGVTIQAGLKFRGALRRVGERFESPVVDEFKIALQQMDVGASRRSAFEGVRERNDSPSLNRFIGSLLQAEELGAPLTDALVSIANDMRKSFAQNVRKRAAKAAPKVTLVATTLLMPGAALLLIGGLLIGGDLDVGAIVGS